MSVIANKRKTAFSEFERQAIELCKHTEERLRRVPSRYKKFINPKLYDTTNRVAALLIYANEEDARTEAGRARRTAYFQRAVKELIDLQKPLFAAWNVLTLDEAATQRWADRVNRVVSLVWRVGRWNEEEKPMIIPLPVNKMEKLAFLRNMAELHRYTYQKIGHAPQYCKDTISGQIAEFVNTALAEVVMANRKEPQTRKEADERAAHLLKAVQSLNAMQRPLLALWLLMGYSETIMNEWAGMINEELKMLAGLKKSDTERFKNLK